MVKKLIILIASLLGLISTFLPWATVSVSVLGQSASESVNGTEGDGWITLILFVAIIVITVVSGLKDFKKEIPMWAKIAITAVAAICAVIAIVDCGNVADSVSGVSSAVGLFGATANTSIGIGLILIIIMSIVNAVAVWLPLEKWIKFPAGKAAAPAAPTAQTSEEKTDEANKTQA